jgi:hypothetical protein
MFVKPICCSTIPFVPSEQQTRVAGKGEDHITQADIQLASLNHFYRH